MVENTDNTAVEEKKETASIEVAVQEAVEQQKIEGAPDAPPKNEEQSQEELTPEEINWRKFRQKRNEDRKNAEEAHKTAEVAQNQSKQKDEQIAALTTAIDNMLESKGKQSMTQSEQDKMISDLVDEDIPTGGEVKGFLKKFVPELIKDVLNKNKEEERQRQSDRERKEMPNNLQKRHTDFKEIVHQENLDYLDYHYPDIAGALAHLPEGVEKWSSIYNTVKKLVPNVGKGDARRLDQNSQKPQAMTSTSASPSEEKGHGKYLSPAEKSANYKRLIELSRGA